MLNRLILRLERLLEAALFPRPRASGRTAARRSHHASQAFADRYSGWRAAAADAAAAYARWTAANPADRALAYACYQVALDMEELACRSYAESARTPTPTPARAGARAKLPAAA